MHENLQARSENIIENWSMSKDKYASRETHLKSVSPAPSDPSRDRPTNSISSVLKKAVT